MKKHAINKNSTYGEKTGLKLKSMQINEAYANQ